MSEWDAHVHCTCFQDGLTTEPPYPRSELIVNRFGVVTLAGSTDHSEDPDDLWSWRCGYSEDGYEVPYPCEHDQMKLVSISPFYAPDTWPRVDPAYPQLEGVLATSDCTVLRELFRRHPTYDHPSGGIWVLAEEADRALNEWSGLLTQFPADLAPGDAYFVEEFPKLLKASVQTGNPIICHHNGVGDGAW